MSTIRLNITLPSDVVATIKNYSGSKGQSAFIAESVRFFAKKKRQEQLVKELVEGYQRTAEEDRSLLYEFEASDLDGWDEV